jgi:Cytochrome c554 and c-prime
MDDLYPRAGRRFGWAAISVAGLIVACALSVRGEPGPAADKSPTANAAAKSSTSADKSVAADSIAKNSPIFVDWPKPEVALLFSGEQDGYLEPCGCAGLENQKGGLKRRFTLIKQLRDKGWSVVPMDLGGQAKRFGKQAEMKFDFALKALMEMDYQAVGFGPQDLTMDVLTLAINLPEAKNPLVSANVALVDFDSGFTKRFKIIEAGGMKIGVTAVLGKKQLAGLKNSDDLKIVEPYQAIPDVLPKLINAHCDHLVLLSFADPDETKDLARRFPEFDFVVTALSGGEPPNVPQAIEGTKSQLIECGEKAEYVIVLGLYKDATTPWRYQRVPLDSRFPEAPEMQKLLVDYQHELETLGLEGLGIKASANMTGRKFVGSKVCADCHTAAAAVFEKTPHAHATETLINLKPPRHFDPECLSCHVTGWEPQKFFPYTSGYLNLKDTPQMVGNGCENCHGPAAEHVAAEQGDEKVTDKTREERRAALRLKVVENEGNKSGPMVNGKPGEKQKDGKVTQMCMECHDLDNSPAFDFQEYWPKVKHHGKD